MSRFKEQFVTRSIGESFALAFGIWLTATGLAALLAAPTIWDTEGVIVQDIRVNGWHALFHLIPGLIGIAYSRSPVKARNFVLSCGAFYALVAILHCIYGSPVFGLIATDSFGNFVHSVEAALALGYSA